MSRYKGWRQFSLMLGIFILSISPSHSLTISYHLEIDEQDWDSYHIRMTAENVDQARLIYAMPAWRPGAYIRKDFGQFVQNFQAWGESGQPLKIVKLNRNEWDVENENSSLVRIEYDIDERAARFMGPQLDSSFALVDGAMNFMYLKGHEHLPVLLSVRVPHGWKLATALPPLQSTFEFTADNYHHLIDSPLFMSQFQEYYFTCNERPVYTIISGTLPFDINEFLVKIKRIVSYDHDFFGGLPFEKYYFLFHITGDGLSGGGLEHRSSSVITFSESTNMQTAANIIAHEFFHVWNVKRIYPSVLSPFDYSQEARTKSLWFTEGVTSYYADLTLVRTHIWTDGEFLKHQEELIEHLEENADRSVTSVEKASLDAWENGYHGAGISYYIKGHLIGLLLDLSMREFTENQSSLDRLMRFMDQWFGEKNVGFEEDDLLRATNALTHRDFTDFFNRYVSGTVDLPYSDILAYAGIKADITSSAVPDVGLIKISNARNKIIVLDEAGPMARAGLKRGDLLISIDEKTISSNRELQEIVNSLKIGTEVKIGGEREGIALILTATVGQKAKIEAHLNYLSAPDERQLRIREGLLTP